MSESSVIHWLALGAFCIVFMSNIGHAIKEKSFQTFITEVKDSVLHLDERLKTQVQAMTISSVGNFFGYIVLFSLLYLYFYVGYLLFSVVGKALGIVGFLLVFVAILTLLPIMVLDQPFDLKHSMPVVNGVFSGVKEAALYILASLDGRAYSPTLPDYAVSVNSSFGELNMTHAAMNSTDSVDLR